MKEICIICDTEIANDPRVMRQINALSGDNRLTVVGRGELNLPQVTMLSWDACYRNAANRLEWAWYLLCHMTHAFTVLEKRFSVAHEPLLLRRFDLVIVNEVISLPLGFLISQGAPVYCDLHEYYFDMQPGDIRSRLTVGYYKYLCNTYLSRCAAVSTVCDGLARIYESIARQAVLVIHNVPSAQDLRTIPPDERRIRLIHHGYADPRRHIEGMIEMMDYVDARFTLDLMLTTKSAYRDFLQAEAAKRPNIAWKEPVPMPEICRTINVYDLGLYLLPPHTVNTKFSLPNKFFEFIQARLGIAIGPSHEMAVLVRQHDLGIVADDFVPQSMAKRLNVLTVDDIARFKGNADKIAPYFSSEEAGKTIRDTVNKLLH